jgi:phospholipase/carboxylesterase
MLHAGADAAHARGAVILLHGRGATAEDILGVSDYLAQPGLAWFAPQAAGRVWLPNRHFAPFEDNEPSLSSVLGLVEDLTLDLIQKGIAAERVFIGGFSQGACITTEFAFRHPRRWGGFFVWSGSTLGPAGAEVPAALRPEGSFEGTPVVVACGDSDSYFDVGSVRQTAALFRDRGAAVEELIIAGLDHRISDEALELAHGVLQRGLASPAMDGGA